MDSRNKPHFVLCVPSKAAWRANWLWKWNDCGANISESEYLQRMVFKGFGFIARLCSGSREAFNP